MEKEKQEKNRTLIVKEYYESLSVRDKNKLTFILSDKYGKYVGTWHNKLMGHTQMDLCELECIEKIIKELQDGSVESGVLEHS